MRSAGPSVRDLRRVGFWRRVRRLEVGCLREEGGMGLREGEEEVVVGRRWVRSSVIGWRGGKAGLEWWLWLW